MDDFVPPAHGHEPGPLLAPDVLVTAFIDGAHTGWCAALRAEQDLLITIAGAVAAIRLAPGSVLVRGIGALTDPAADVRPALGRAGLRAVQDDPPLADVVALMRCGLRGTPWDLWGRGEQAAIQALEQAAVGDVDVDLRATAARLQVDLAIADYESVDTGLPDTGSGLPDTGSGSPDTGST